MFNRTLYASRTCCVCLQERKNVVGLLGCQWHVDWIKPPGLHAAVSVTIWHRAFDFVINPRLF